MSHIASVNCQIKDLDALELAAQKFNARLVRGKTSFKAYYGDTNTKCQHVVEMVDNPKGYSIGLRQKAQADEEYELACDFFDGSLAKAFGPELVNLRNEYQVAVVQANLPRGYRFQREDVGTQIRLRATA